MTETVRAKQVEKFAISQNFAPWPAAMGGVAIGTVAVSRMLLWGKITGISGIVSGIITSPRPADWASRVAFGSGLLACGGAMQVADVGIFESAERLSWLRLATAGALVGFGSQLGNGCTSGHGICGIGRLSPRSLVATPVFMATGCLTAVLSSTAQHVPSHPSPASSATPNPALGLAAAAGTVAVTAAAMRHAAAHGAPLLAQELAMGAAFAAGLGVSGMVKPSKVAGFLDPVGQPWDPSLAFVMGGALTVAVLGFRSVLARRAPALAASFALPARRDIDLPLVAGGAVFGVGWGLAGMCPGPAMVNLGSGQAEAAVFVGAMLAGFKAQSLLKRPWVPIAAPLVAAAAAAVVTALESPASSRRATRSVTAA